MSDVTYIGQVKFASQTPTAFVAGWRVPHRFAANDDMTTSLDSYDSLQACAAQATSGTNSSIQDVVLVEPSLKSLALRGHPLFLIVAPGRLADFGQLKSLSYPQETAQ